MDDVVSEMDVRCLQLRGGTAPAGRVTWHFLPQSAFLL